MKLTILFIILPFLAFSTPASVNPTSTNLKPETFRFGQHVTHFSRLFNKKKVYVSQITTHHYLKDNIFNTGSAKTTASYIIAENDMSKSLSLIFDKVNGIKYLNHLAEQFGEPIEQMVDNYQWTINGIKFEIHETEDGYTATYRNAE